MEKLKTKKLRRNGPVMKSVKPVLRLKGVYGGKDL